MIEKRIILNAAYEACFVPQIRKAVVKIYDSFIPLYEKNKYSKQDIAKISSRVLMKDTDDIAKIAAVFKKSLSHPPTGKALSEVLTKLQKPDIALKEMANFLYFTAVMYIYLDEEIPQSEEAINTAKEVKSFWEHCFSDVDGKESRKKTIASFTPEDPLFEELVKCAEYGLTKKSVQEALAGLPYFTDESTLAKFKRWNKLTGARPSGLMKSVTFSDEEMRAYAENVSAGMAIPDTIKRSKVFDTRNDATPATTQDILFLAIQRYFWPIYHLGLDGSRILFSTPITPKEINVAFKEAFFNLTLTNNRETTTVLELVGVVEEALHFLFIKRLSSLSLGLVSQKKSGNAKADEINKNTQNQLRKLLEENERLKASLKEEKKKLEPALKKLKDENKALRSELYELNKEIEIEELEEEVVISEAEEPEQESDVVEETPIDIQEFLSNHKILFWGVRDNQAQKLEQAYPCLSLKGSKDSITYSQLKAYDAVIIGINGTGHVPYYRFKDLLKNCGLPYVHLALGSSNPVHIEKAISYLAKSVEPNETLN